MYTPLELIHLVMSAKGGEANKLVGQRSGCGYTSPAGRVARCPLALLLLLMKPTLFLDPLNPPASGCQYLYSARGGCSGTTRCSWTCPSGSRSAEAGSLARWRPGRAAAAAGWAPSPARSERSLRGRRPTSGTRSPRTARTWRPPDSTGRGEGGGGGARAARQQQAEATSVRQRQVYRYGKIKEKKEGRVSQASYRANLLRWLSRASQLGR